ncbi:MAG TPA: helix-turn-helix domain-containing protein [Solirubrobacteraceae bacterium]
MAPVWPVIPPELAAEADETLTNLHVQLEQLRGRCSGYPDVPTGELLRAAALIDRASTWFAEQAAEKPAGDRVFAVLPRSAEQAVTVEAAARAAGVAPSTARRYLQQLVHEGRAFAFTNAEHRSTRYYRNPLNGERTTYGDAA